MAGNWQSLEKQVRKVREVNEKLTPPEPDDEFETIRRNINEEMKRLESYVRVRHTGVPED